MGDSQQVLGCLGLDLVMVLGKSLRVEGASERLGFPKKSYGGKSFIAVEGHIAQLDKIDKLLRDLENKRVSQNHNRGRWSSRDIWISSGLSSSTQSQARVMEITII
jgi:hypothetical protein